MDTTQDRTATSMSGQAGRAMPKGRGPRKNLAESLRKLHHLDPDSDEVRGFWRDMEEAEQLEVESLTFRHHC